MDQSRADEIFATIGKFTVDLPADAWSLGPKYVHEMISLTRGLINNISFILQELLQERQTLSRAKHAAEAVLSIESSRLSAEDDRVRRQPNIEDRKLQINFILRVHVQEIQRLDGELLNLGYVEKAVKHRYNELKSTMSDIKAQRALIRDAIDSGSFYGDETETSRSRVGGEVATDDFSESAIDKDMAELDAMFRQETAPEVVEAPAAVEAEVKPTTHVEPAPLAPPLKVALPEEDNFLDLISGMEDSPAPETPTPPVAKPDFGPEDPDLGRFLDGDDLFDDELQSV